mmetsp:Transcript_35038/g.56594  ORF Transcript_35038/g.56594 Transcript_35038/m.56594 type:complete len:380 (-) Transcript_35038:190-1329(-)
MAGGAIYRSNPQLWQMLIKLGISMGVTMYLTKWLVQLMEPMIDPNYKQKKDAEKSRKSLMLRLGRKDIETNDYEDVIAKEAVNPADIDCTFADIGGLDEEKKRLRELVVLPFARPELFSRGKLLRPPKGVLLYGPPGTGKTMLAKAIARETKAVFLNISLSTLQDKWFGESQKLVKAVFTLAWKLQPAIIFIDEIDSFLRERKDSEYEGTTNMKSEFMALWDGMQTDDVAQVIVVGASNRPWAIDKAILRRMPRPFLIDLPAAKQRSDILKKLLQHEAIESLDYDLLASSTAGYSGSDLKELCRAALLAPVQDLMTQEDASGSQIDDCDVQLRALRMDDIIAAKTMVTPTGEEASEYFTKATGMNKSDFDDFINGLNRQ